MAVTRADKEQELQELTSAFESADTAILVDYRGLNVPQVTELRRQIRAARGKYKVVKNTLAKRASKGTRLAADIRAIRPGIPIILATGFGGDLDSRAMQAAGLYGPLQKPFTGEALFEAVDGAFGQRI